MPVQSIAGPSTLTLTFQVGITDEGNPVRRSRSFGNVRPDAADQDLYDVAVALSQLQVHPLLEVRRADRKQLTV